MLNIAKTTEGIVVTQRDDPATPVHSGAFSTVPEAITWIRQMSPGTTMIRLDGTVRESGEPALFRLNPLPRIEEIA